MQKKKYLFSNDIMKEALILGIIKVGVGTVCLSSLIYHIYIYTTQPGPINAKLKLTTDDQFNTANPIADFLIWGSDRRLLMVILPYFDCICLTGFILIAAGYRRVMELFQLWIISAIIFSMVDMILIIPSVSYAQDKIIVLATYIFSCIRKLYTFWIVKQILGTLRAEAEDAQDEDDCESSSFKRY